MRNIYRWWSNDLLYALVVYVNKSFLKQTLSWLERQNNVNTAVYSNIVLVTMELLVGLKRYILFCGVVFIVLGLVVILCDAMTNNEQEESLKARQSSTAFWVGLPVRCLIHSQVEKRLKDIYV